VSLSFIILAIVAFVLPPVIVWLLSVIEDAMAEIEKSADDDWLP